jgi:hypothetical protein
MTARDVDGLEGGPFGAVVRMNDMMLREENQERK